jgi:hypothetical protein
MITDPVILHFADSSTRELRGTGDLLLRLFQAYSVKGISVQGKRHSWISSASLSARKSREAGTWWSCCNACCMRKATHKTASRQSVLIQSEAPRWAEFPSWFSSGSRARCVPVGRAHAAGWQHWSRRIRESFLRIRAGPVIPEVDGYLRTQMGRSLRPPSGEPDVSYEHAKSDTRFLVRSNQCGLFQRLQHGGQHSDFRIDYVIGSGSHASCYLARVGEVPTSTRVMPTPTCPCRRSSRCRGSREKSGNKTHIRRSLQPDQPGRCR